MIRVYVVTFCMIILAFLFSGCDLKREELKISSHHWIGYETLFLANQFGWFDSTIILNETKNATQSIKDLQNGLSDGAALTLDEVLLARDLGIDLTIVLVFNISAGADVLMVRNDIKTLQDLKSKKIGVESGALGSLMLTKILTKANLDLDDVEVIDLTIDLHEKAFINQEVDCVITYEPIASKIANIGGYKIFDSKEIPDTIFDVLAIKSDILGKNQDIVKKFIHSHFKAQSYLRVNKEDAIYRIAAMQNTNYLDVNRALRGVVIPNLNGNYYYLQENSTFYEAIFYINNIMAKNNLISKQDDLNNIFSNQYLPKVEESF